MFGEFVTPEIPIRTTLGNPVFIHISQQIKLAEWSEEGGDARAGVGWDGGAGGGASGCFR